MTYLDLWEALPHGGVLLGVEIFFLNESAFFFIYLFNTTTKTHDYYHARLFIIIIFCLFFNLF